MMKILICIAVIFLTFDAAYCSGPEWNQLRVRFDFNPFRAFYRMPRTVSDAVKEKWEKLDNACEGNKFLGQRYVLRKETTLDYSIILLFDVNGYIAGIQTSVSKQFSRPYPPSKQRPPFIQDGFYRYVITAYFVDPSIICTRGRTNVDFEQQGTGTGLYLQLSEKPLESTMMPMKQADIQAPWVTGKCVPLMGDHIWYNVTKNMDCEDHLPIFLLYNKGKLNAFGWATLTELHSPMYEHPATSVLNKFFKEVPQCLLTQEHITTQHIYFDSPYDNFC